MNNNTFGEPRSENTFTGMKAKQSTLSSMWGNKTKTKTTITNEDTINTCEPKLLNNETKTPDEKNEVTLTLSGRTDTLHAPLSDISITYDMNDTKFTGEGRVITLECQYFFFVACYVPNSGEGLRRLDYRLNEWDPKLRSYLLHLNQTKPVILGGDLNVAHLDVDFYNPTAKHISKQAGLTPQERASFSVLLSAGFFDAFRTLHPDAKGHYTYWSQRASNRSSNRGLRLDYFVCSNDMLPSVVPSASSLLADAGDAESGKGGEGKRQQEDEVNDAVSNEHPPLTTSTINRPIVRVVDSCMIYDDTLGFSDHCPILLTIEIKVG